VLSVPLSVLQGLHPSRVLSTHYNTLYAVLLFGLFFGGPRLWPNKQRRMMTGYGLYVLALVVPPLVSVTGCTALLSRANMPSLCGIRVCIPSSLGHQCGEAGWGAVLQSDFKAASPVTPAGVSHRSIHLTGPGPSHTWPSLVETLQPLMPTHSGPKRCDCSSAVRPSYSVRMYACATYACAMPRRLTYSHTAWRLLGPTCGP
jgi:hypothetical protein